MKKWLPVIVVSLAASLLVIALREKRFQADHVIASHDPSADITTTEPITPIPLSIDLDASKVALGERLFNDPQLSRDDSISCASCHSLATGGTDRRVHSVGIGARAGLINAPTVFNVGFNFKQFWDGRAQTLEDQVDAPTHDPLEMGSDWPQIVQKLRLSSSYVSAFAASYADGVKSDNIRDAIAIFERSLITPNSRFDRYLRGERGVLTSEELDGYRLFKEYGCASCHQGVNVGGNLFQKLGVMGDYFAARGDVTRADLGRFNITNDAADKHVFKVPSLRNVALTAPYLHDGTAVRLSDAVTLMSVYQLGHPLTGPETEAIVKFLETLSGEYKGQAL